MPSLDFIIILLIIVIVLVLISLNSDQLLSNSLASTSTARTNNPNIILNLNGRNNYDISINDNNDNNNNNNNKENFEIVSLVENQVKFPLYDNILRYNDMKKCNINDNIELQKSDNIELIHNNHTYRILKDNIQLPLEACVYSYGNNNEDFDYGEFYRKKIVIHKSYLEDPKTRGHNLHDFDQYAGIYEIGRIPIEKNVKHPVPYRYAFTL
jgi:hypothetical protein